MVNLVGLGPGEVENDYKLHGCHLPRGENNSLVAGHKVSSEPGLSGVAMVVVV